MDEKQPRAVTGVPTQLNLGCGDDYRRGWWNVDAHKGHGVVADVQGDAVSIGRRGYKFDRILCSHMIEHVHWVMVLDELRAIRLLLAPRGEACFVFPDASKLEPGDPDELMVRTLWGTRRHSGDYHWWAPTVPLVSNLLLLAGYAHIRSVSATNHDAREWKIRDLDNHAQSIVIARRGE